MQRIRLGIAAGFVLLLCLSPISALHADSSRHLQIHNKDSKEYNVKIKCKGGC